METKTGMIEKKDKSSGINKKGEPYTRWVFTISGQKYSTFDEKIGESFNVGENVEIEGEQKGAYWNMQTMSICENKEQPEAPKSNEVTDLLRQILAELKAVHHGNN